MKYAIAFATVVALALPTVAVAQADLDHAIECMAYGAFARHGDPRDEAAKRAIDATVDQAVASGQISRKQLSEEFGGQARLAIAQEPRAELDEKWAECRESFAP